MLADLLADDDIDKKTIAEASEINDIQELDNLDFDELLANIEEETTPENVEEFELNDEFDAELVLDSSLDIGDDLIASLPAESTNELEKDFVSVDSLLSDSFEGTTLEEPYDKTSIDVGLDEFPEFGGDMTTEDIDDDNGMEAKLDLAKVYIEIDDKENAEVILLDVVVKGDPQQQLDAQQLLDNLM